MKLSVIVCTQNRAYAITGCLDSIAAALSNASPVDAEIVVVDNASEDDTSVVVKKWLESCAFPVQLVLEPRKGLAIARNCGIGAAQGELVVFTDDDCRLSNNYIIDALRYNAQDTELVLRGGRVELGDPTDLPLTIKTLPTLKRWQKQSNSLRDENLGNSLLGCNMIMRRSLIDQLGLFDEWLGAGSALPAAEDTDYIFRAYLANIIIEYVPDMAVSHYHGRKLIADGNKLFRNYMIGGGALYAKYIFKYPNFCRQFYWDMKHAIREIISGKNTFMPVYGFSYKDRIAYSALGAIRYFSLMIRGKK
jgi:glycosyltransferase involved in cell wall biosynthesis